MAPIEAQPDPAQQVLTVPAGLSATALWPWLAEQAMHWLAERQLPPRDAIVLLPYAALLPLARQAFAERGGWQPRIETARTLRELLAPLGAPPSDGISGDAVRDRLAAAALLRQLPWGRERERSDSAAFAHLADLVADAAQELVRAGDAVPPEQRPEHGSRVRQTMPGLQGPDALEAALLRVAVEWAALDRTAALDPLFLQRPSAWIVLRIGGADRVSEALLGRAGVASLLVDADPPSVDDPFAPFLQAGGARLTGWLCDDLESEAAAAAAQVIEKVEQGSRPAALVSLDRQVVRRARGHLERAGLVVSDETGWRLSTTPAAGELMALLRAAAPDAGPDARLAWLKAGAAAGLPWVDALEAVWRGARSAVSPSARQRAEQRWEELERGLAPWQEAARRPLSGWLTLLEGELRSGREHEDAVRRALHLDDRSEAWQALARQTVIDLYAFTAWVDQVLDGANHEPPRADDPDVVITPLARAIGRPFAHVVMPGADQRQLGARSTPPGLISEALARRWHLEHEGDRQQRQRLALAQLLRSPGVTFLRRRFEGAEPLAASAWVQWLLADAGAAAVSFGVQPPAEQDWAPARRAVERRPQAPALPIAAEALPERLSASAIEALRDCPYRFFARSVLRLGEAEELEREAGKREYGTWLHEVLDHFHRQRATGDATRDRESDVARMAQSAAHANTKLGIGLGELLPFMASFEAFAPAYLAWLAEREAAGWTWHDGELALQARPTVLLPQMLEGRLDRLDLKVDGSQTVAEVIDYKTGSVQPLAKKIRQPLEDTQLVFYATLLREQRRPLQHIQAAYLAVDTADAPKALVHKDVEAAIDPLLQGLSEDLAALRAGAPMPALGEDPVCEFCEARGLCRRDHRPSTVELDTA